MTRAPLESHVSERALDEMTKEVARQRKKREPKPKAPELPAWFTAQTLQHADAVNADEHPTLRATPLDTILAMLLDDETEVESSYGERTAIRIKTIASGPVFRVAVLALRLEHADAAAVAEHRRLSATIEQLKEQRDALGEKLPREVRRGW